MKKKDRNYENKLKVIDRRIRRYIDIKWVITITITAYLISLLFSGISELLVPKLNTVAGLVVILFIIILNISADILGVSVMAANIAPFNAMASKKVAGSKMAIKMIKNAEKVAAFCNDVIGDVCGVISGSVGALIATVIAKEHNFNLSVTTLVLTAIIAALTIGGKACGKSYAINKSDVIIFRFAKFTTLFRKEKVRK